MAERIPDPEAAILAAAYALILSWPDPGNNETAPLDNPGRGKGAGNEAEILLGISLNSIIAPTISEVNKNNITNIKSSNQPKKSKN